MPLGGVAKLPGGDLARRAANFRVAGRVNAVVSGFPLQRGGGCTRAPVFLALLALPAVEGANSLALHARRVAAGRGDVDVILQPSVRAQETGCSRRLGELRGLRSGHGRRERIHGLLGRVLIVRGSFFLHGGLGSGRGPENTRLDGRTRQSLGVLQEVGVSFEQIRTRAEQAQIIVALVVCILFITGKVLDESLSTAASRKLAQMTNK